MTQASRSLPRRSLACSFSHSITAISPSADAIDSRSESAASCAVNVGALLGQRGQSLVDRRHRVIRDGGSQGGSGTTRPFSPAICASMSLMSAARPTTSRYSPWRLPLLEQHQRRQFAQQRARRQHQQPHLQFWTGTGKQMQDRARSPRPCFARRCAIDRDRPPRASAARSPR